MRQSMVPGKQVGSDRGRGQWANGKRGGMEGVTVRQLTERGGLTLPSEEETGQRLEQAEEEGRVLHRATTMGAGVLGKRGEGRKTVGGGWSRRENRSAPSPSVL